jgi:radical SAM protein with 4Fe4S-binding SPASM domain
VKCTYLPELSYGEFSKLIHQKAITERIPINGSFEVTARCNLNCAHCYINIPATDKNVRTRELNYRQWCHIIDQIVDEGCLWLLLTGGEPFIRADFLAIYAYAKSKGLLITLFTNGTLLTPKIADYLAEWRPFSIETTLYGRTKETYERITRKPGSYERCMRGISLLMERGLPLKLKTMAITLNKHEIWDIKRFVEEDQGLQFRFDPMVNPRYDYSQSPLDLRLTPQEVVELDLQDPKRMAGWKVLAEMSKGPVYCSDELYYCRGGITGFIIDPYGKLDICFLTHNNRYNLQKGTFRKGWEEFLLKERSTKITRQTKCVGCAIKALCGMCPPSGELENRDQEAPVDFYCHVAHLRAYVLDYLVPPHGDCEYCESGRRYDELMQSVAAMQSRYGLRTEQ